MHELSIAHSILSIAEKSAPAEGNGIITAVSMQIGELSSIEIDSLRFAFEAIKTATVLEKAELDIAIIEGEAKCLDCKTVFHLNAYGTACPNCKSYGVTILKGTEMKILSLTIDE